MPLRNALLALLAAAGLAALLWLGWQFARMIADAFAALMFIVTLAATGA